MLLWFLFFFFFQAEDGIRDTSVTGVQTCALPICLPRQIERIDRDAVTPETRPRIKRREPEGLRRRRLDHLPNVRSEERRVGKECRTRRSAQHEKKKEKIHMRESINRDKNMMMITA